jgi:hypothetical protein
MLDSKVNGLPRARIELTHVRVINRKRRGNAPHRLAGLCLPGWRDSVGGCPHTSITMRQSGAIRSNPTA